MITKKTVNGKDLITSCTLANCCLTSELVGDTEIKLTNEKGQELICAINELEELFFHLQCIGLASYSGIGT